MALTLKKADPVLKIRYATPSPKRQMPEKVKTIVALRRALKKKAGD